MRGEEYQIRVVVAVSTDRVKRSSQNLLTATPTAAWSEKVQVESALSALQSTETWASASSSLPASWAVRYRPQQSSSAEPLESPPAPSLSRLAAAQSQLPWPTTNSQCAAPTACAR